LQRFLGKYFGFLEFGLLVIRSAKADRDERIPFQNIENATKTIADPERFVADPVDFLRCNRFFFFFFALRFFLVFIARFFVADSSKSLETTAKGFGNGSSPSVGEEKSEFDRVAPQGDPTKRRPTRPSLAVCALAFWSANHKRLDHPAISPIPSRLCGS
jgi:hypothetical protein